MLFKSQPTPHHRIKVFDQLFLYEQVSLAEVLYYKDVEEDDSETNENAFLDEDSEGFFEWLDSSDEGAQENILNVMDS